jgi:signal peptidase II
VAGEVVRSEERAPRAALAWARAALVVVAVVVLDQLTKHAVADSGLHLVHTRNQGVAFGVLPGNHAIEVVIILAALVALAVYFALHATRPLVWLPTGLLIGGALGNILDRVREGAVTDFIKLPLWPPFNLADASITFGVLILIYVIERGPPHPAP